MTNNPTTANTTTDNSNELLTAATFTTTAPCQYHPGQSLSIYGLSLMHDGGRVLFDNANVTISHGCITGIVGTNGAGKTTFARTFASKALDGFPTMDNLTVEYLAAADDEDGHDHDDEDDDEGGHNTMKQKPREYIQNRLQLRLDGVRQRIVQIEQRMEDGDLDELEALAEEASNLYNLEESMNECMQRETDVSMERVGLNAHTHKNLSQLSCGWRYKCRLIAAVLTHPDCLIIDEPSFLDSSSLEWLMEQLRNLAKNSDTDQSAMVLLISHKETLLDALCDKIIHINSANLTLTMYNCGYAAFRDVLESEIQHTSKTLHQTQDNLETADKSLKKIQAVSKKREGNMAKVTAQNSDKRFIKGKAIENKQKADRSAASKLKKAQQAVKDAEEIKHKAKRERVKPLHIQGMPSAEGTLVTLQNVGLKYDDEDWIFQNVDTSLEASDRVLLSGANGCGKTSLVKIILDELEPSEGEIHHRPAIQNSLLYFPQTALYQLLRQHGNKTAMEFLQQSGAKTLTTETDVRHHLGDLGLAKDLALHKIKTLSAGQRVRLWLAYQLLLHPKPSLLILDEMSENVDVETRNSLVEMLESFEGAVLVISHDPDFCSSFNKSMTKKWKLWRHGLQVEFQE